MKRISCGIDFGTSNSSVAIANDGKVTLVPLEDLNVTIPSAMFFTPGAPPLFGRQAMKSFFERKPGRFMRSLKRVLGTRLMNQGTLINGKVVKFDRIIGSFLTALRTRAHAFAGNEIDHVVMGRPVHFVDKDRDADKKAEEELRSIASAVGFKHIEFQFEPIAAAFAHESAIRGEQLAIVVDLGGGTSDFTVIRLSKDFIGKSDRSSDVLGSSGVRIGGNDFDKELCLNMVMPELGYKSLYGKKNLEVPLRFYHDLSEWSKVNFLYTPKILSQVRQLCHEAHDRARLGRLLTVIEQESGHLVLSAAEKSKIALTSADNFAIQMEFLEKDFSIPVERNAFEFAIAMDVQKIADAANECLVQAAVKASDIQLVILTGGSTEIPMIQSAFKNLFPTAQIADENKLSSVGLGLAYDSQRRFQ